MYRNMAQLYRNNQIIDVTKECTFEWVREPAFCYAYLEVSGASGDFTEGETVTGQNSGATATVFSSYVDGGRVYVTDVSGTFQAGETITGSSSNQTATVDGFVPERSYTSTPNNITHGTFDSIFNRDLDDYLEWESSASGAGYIGKFRITIKADGIFSFVGVFGTGQQVDTKLTTRIFRWQSVAGSCATFSSVSEQGMASSSGWFEKYIGNITAPFGIFIKKDTGIQAMFYQNNKGTFRWRIHNIRVLKLVI